MNDSINNPVTQADSLHNVQQAENLTGQVNSQARTVADIVGEAVNQPTADEQGRSERRCVLASMRVASTTEVQPEEAALTVDGVGLFALSDIHGLKGKQKCGKTTALKVCLAAWMSGRQFRVTSGLEEPRVLYMDTEQKQSDVKLIVTDVIQMTGLDAAYVDAHLQVYALRRRDFNLLLDDMRLLICDFRPHVVIVDGIVEFVASFNDESMAKQLIHELLCISEESRLAMVCVLHTNKADEDHNMRGHLGTMLAQKAGTVLECRKQSGIITVSCSDARHQEMPDWSIMFDDGGHILDADERRRQAIEQRRAELQQKRQEACKKEMEERLSLCLRIIRNNGGAITRKELTELLVNELGRERSTVSTYITKWLKDKAVIEANSLIQNPNEQPVLFGCPR